MDQAYLSGLEETLKQITNAGTVNEATVKLQKDFYDHAQAIPAVIHLMQTSNEIQIRQLAGVEARKLISQKWVTVEPQVQQQIRNSLLESTLKEENALVRHTSSRVISEIATTDLSELLSGGNQWPDLLPYLFNAIKSQNSAEREVAIYVLYTLIETDVEPLKENKIDLLQLFGATIQDSSLQVRVTTVQALQAMSDTIDSTVSKNEVEPFRALIPSCVEVLKQSITEGDEKGTSDIFEFFNNLLIVDSALVSKHLGKLIEFMLNEISLQSGLDEENRMCGLRFLISAVMYKKSKIQSLKVGPTIAKACMDIMSEGFEDDEDDDDLEDTPGGLSFRLLEGLSNNLAPSQSAGPMIQLFPQYVQGNSNQRKAAFNAVTASVEGAPDFLANEIDSILPYITQGLQDEDLGVVANALFALAELTTQLQELVVDNHEVLLPMVCNILDRASTLKIGKYACHALDSMLDCMDREVIATKYLDSLVPKLLQLLDGAQDLSLKSAIVAAISSAASSAGKAFQPYFEHTCQSVQNFIKTPNSPDEEIPPKEVALCGITLDLLSNVAAAVGRDNFRPFVDPLVGAAYKCLQCEQSRMKDCGFIFIGTIAKVYEQEFGQYMEKIMPEVFKTLEQDEMEGLLESFEQDGNIGMDGEEEGIDNEQFAVTNAIINEKENAIDALGEIITGVKQDFAPYLERSCALLADNCSHYHTPLAISAINALWKAFITFYNYAGCEKWTPGFPAQYTVPEPASSIAKKAREESLQRLSEAEDRSIAMSILDRFTEGIKLGGPWVLGNEEDLQRLFGEVVMILAKSHPSQTMEDEFELSGQEKSQDQEEESSEYDEVLIDSAMDVVVQIASVMGVQFKPLWPTVYPILERYCTNQKNKNERSSGIGAISEIINGIRGDVSEYTVDLYNLLVKCLEDRDLEVRSNAAYGAGLLVYWSQNKEFIQNNLMNILSKLQRLLKKVDKESRKFGNVVDESDTSEAGLANACGCVSRMALKYPDLVPISQVMPVLVSHLPLKSSFEENAPIFDLIVDQFGKQDETVVGMRSQIVDVFDRVFAQQVEQEATRANQPFYLASQGCLPFVDNAMKEKVVNLLKYLESQEQGLVSTKDNLRTIL